MNTAMLAYEMAATVERERMAMIADLNRMQLVARAGHDGGLTARVRMIGGALVRRLGRPQSRGSAPAADRTQGLEQPLNASVPLGTASMTVARF
jgi:hypothetical protein